MHCVTCNTKLKETILSNTAADYCPKCLGLWFEKNELGWAKNQADKNLNWLDIDLWADKKKLKISVIEILCPVCRLPLYEVRYGKSKIKVDVCTVCNGIWLDRGEFKKIIKYLKKEADFEILNNYAKTLLEEGLEIFSGPETLREEIADFLTVLKLLKYKFSVQHPTISKLISKLPR